MSLDYLHCARNHWTDQVRLSNHIPWDSLNNTLLQRYEFYIFRIFSNNIKWVKNCVKKLYVYKRKKKPNVFPNVDLWLNKNITEKIIRLFLFYFRFLWLTLTCFMQNSFLWFIHGWWTALFLQNHQQGTMERHF